jgi:hypothetical protein
MTTTITGTTVTFTDGSTWGGANGALTPDTNSSRTSLSYNVGYLAFANTVFSAGAGFSTAGVNSWGLNRDRFTSVYYDTAQFTSAQVFVNVGNTYNAYLGSQNFYIMTVALAAGDRAAGTWRGRGHAMNTGLYQYLGNFVLLERVA